MNLSVPSFTLLIFKDFCILRKASVRAMHVDQYPDTYLEKDRRQNFLSSASKKQIGNTKRSKGRRKFEIQMQAFSPGCVAGVSRILCQDLVLRLCENELSKPPLSCLH